MTMRGKARKSKSCWASIGHGYVAGSIKLIAPCFFTLSYDASESDKVVKNYYVIQGWDG